MRIHCIFLLLLCCFSACRNGDGNVVRLEDVPLEEKTRELRSVLAQKNSSCQDILQTIDAFYPQLNKSKTIDDFEFIAIYQPHLLLALSDKVPSDSYKNAELSNTVKQYAGLHYIQFSIENKDFHSELLRFNIRSAQDYSDRIMYYAFNSNKDTYVIENNKDTIPCSFVHFERTFDVSPKLNLTLVFDKRETTPVEKLNLVFEDVIFNKGKLIFEFDYKDISVLNAGNISKILL